MDGLRAAGVLLGLDRMHLALERLGHPERRTAFVQIAGSNGKGSTAAMVDAVGRAAGLNTALFTSPHLLRFSERLRLQGAEVQPQLLNPALDKVLATQVPLTYFEAATLVAVCLIADADVDLAIMETGLGGRLDAVTALPALACAITSVSDEHLDVLGPTLLHVAREKAGIARPGVPLFLPHLAAPLETEIRNVAALVGAPVHVVKAWDKAVGLAGAHQQSNAGLAVALAQAALATLGVRLDPKVVDQSLTQVAWPGRLEQVGQVLLDCAHNPESANALASALAARPERPRVLVLSVFAGKDIAGITRALWPQVDAVVATQSDSERAVQAGALAAHLPAGPPVAIVADPWDALAHAQAVAGPQGLVVVAGSVFLVGQLRGRLRGEPRDPVPTSDPMPQATLTESFLTRPDADGFVTDS